MKADTIQNTANARPPRHSHFPVALFTLLFGYCVFALPSLSAPRGLTIKETTRHYSISGRTPSEFAASMNRSGPFSFAHRRRAWATATRELSYQLVRQNRNGRCSVRNARVTMTIKYVLPKLRKARSDSSRSRKIWQRMSALLVKHERRHGSLYKQFARKAHRELNRLKPQRTCRALELEASRTIQRLSAEDERRNQEFDRRDQRNYRSMERLVRQS